jgi:uncharacterized membrane protein
VKATAHPLVEGYLRSLDGAAKVLPRRERDELVGEIRGHLDEALSPDASEADVRNVLDSLGTPWDIVAAAGGQTTTVRRGAREVFALILLVTGGFPVPILGWFVGLGLLIWSPLWNVRQKLLGALVWPGGWFGLLFLAAIPASFSGNSTLCGSSGNFVTSTGSNDVVATSCTTTAHTMPIWEVVPLALLAFGLPVLVAIYLWRAAGRQSAA